MALIYCIECGGKISDKAKVCMNCGCPVEITLGALKTEEATKKAEDAEVLEIIDRFDILGKEFTVDEKSDKFIMIKSAIFNTKSDYLSIIKSEYQKMRSIDAVIEEFPEIISTTLNHLVSGAVEIMTSFGLYDYDEYSFYQKYYEFFDTESILEPVVDRYLRILNYEEGLKNYHDQIRKSRSNSWVGGGFGIKGALEGHFKAQLLNAGNAVIHSIPDDIRKNNDLASVRKAKLELYKDESTLNTMLNAMEKIFDSVFDAILVELSNADKIRDVVKNKSKADSIINNVVRLSNENKISDKEQIQYCMEAFFEDPTSFKIIETIILLDLDDSGDVVRYARKYKFYEKIEDHRQSLLRKKYSKEIKELSEASESVSNNEELIKVLMLCAFLLTNGITQDFLEDFITQSIESRLTFPITHEDKNQLVEHISDFDKSQNCSYYEKYESEFKQIKIDSIDSNKVITIIKQACEGYSTGGDLFVGEEGTKSVPHISEYLEYSGVPNSAKIFMLYGVYSYSSKAPNKVLVISDKGLFGYNSKDSWTLLRKSWSDFRFTKLSYDESEGISFDGKFSGICEKKLLDILAKIHDQLIFYYDTHDEAAIQKNEAQVEIAEKELEFIYKTFNSNSDNYVEALRIILKKKIQTESGMSVFSKYEKEILEAYKESCHINLNAEKNKGKAIAKFVILLIISIILTGIWILNFSKLGWIWNIICGFIVLVFWGNVLTLKDKMKGVINEIDNAQAFLYEFDFNFTIENDHIQLREHKTF